MNKIGIDKFYIKELECDIPKDKLDEREKYYIEKFNSFYGGYNATVGGKGGELILENITATLLIYITVAYPAMIFLKNTMYQPQPFIEFWKS